MLHLYLKKLFILGFLVLLTSTSQAQPVSVDLNKELGLKPAVDLYSMGPGSNHPALGALARLKLSEIQLQWNDCVRLSEAAFQNNKDLQGWIARVWLHCLSQAQVKNNVTAKIRIALGKIEKEKLFQRSGPWRTQLFDFYYNLKIQEIDFQIKNKNLAARAELDQLLQQSELLNSERRSQIFERLGDISFSQKMKSEADFFWQQGLRFKSSDSLRNKIAAKPALTVPAVLPAEPVPPLSLEPVQSEDQKILERMNLALKANDPLAALKDAIEILNKYPGSSSARLVAGKPLDIFNTLNGVAAEKSVVEMGKADPSRSIDWAQNLHRRALYEPAQKLALKILDKEPGNSIATSALWIAGRSANFLGQYKEALEHFANLVKFHDGSEEAIEAQFRSGLIYIRKSDFTSAAAMFEKVIAQNKDRYNLSAQYWLYRSLQKSNSARAGAVSKEIIEAYPFSYYGLRLTAEANNGKIVWAQDKENKKTEAALIYLAGPQKEAWERFKKLSSNGWVGEAQEELMLLPFMIDHKLKLAFAKKLAERNQYLTAIKLLNEVMEAEPSYRTSENLRYGYPLIFSDIFKREGKKYQIDPLFLKSLTRQESGFNLSAMSTSNALGLMQMIPGTAKEVAGKLGLNLSLPDDMFRPEVNIPMGTFYINQMLEQFKGSVPFALAGYNAGPYRFNTWVKGRTEVESLLSEPTSDPLKEIWFDELPWNETSFYVKSILRNYIVYKLSETGEFSPKAVLWQDWLTKKVN